MVRKLLKSYQNNKLILDQYENEIVTKLKSIPHFLDEVLIKNLQSFTGLGKKSKSYGEEEPASGLWGTLDPFKFRKYIQISKNNVQQGLGKISEITSRFRKVSCIHQNKNYYQF